MSKTTPEEIKRLALKHHARGITNANWHNNLVVEITIEDFAALIDEVRWVDAEPLCHVVGFPEAGRKVCQLRKGHEGYHQDGSVRWLGYVSAPSQPAAPVELPVVARKYMDDAPQRLNPNDRAMWVTGWNECVEAQAAIATGRKA